MKREISLEEISDGKLYGSGDMVKVGCDDCRGCSACCRGMGSSIVLDPYDVFRLEMGLGLSFEGLLAEAVELNLVDGIILPNLKMSGEGEACTFLNEEGRCRIHPFRPGICRMFPLGRIYEDHGFRYFNQIHECRKEQKTKVKIRKWMDTPDMAVMRAILWSGITSLRSWKKGWSRNRSRNWSRNRKRDQNRPVGKMRGSGLLWGCLSVSI